MIISPLISLISAYLLEISVDIPDQGDHVSAVWPTSQTPHAVTQRGGTLKGAVDAAGDGLWCLLRGERGTKHRAVTGKVGVRKFIEDITVRVEYYNRLE